MASLAFRWPGYLTAVAFAAICAWVLSLLDAAPPSPTELSSHQPPLWDKLTSAHLNVLDICQIRDRDDGPSQRLRGKFERYQNITTGFLKIVHEDMPNALNANSCSSFAHSDRLATQQSSMLSGSFATISTLTPEQLLPQSVRQGIRKDVASATATFSSRVRGMVKRLWYRPAEGITRLLRFDASGGVARSIHGDVGVALLGMRKCVRAVEEMDRALQDLVQHLRQQGSAYADLVAYLATSPKLWEVSELKKGTVCTSEHLEAMGRHHNGLVGLLSGSH